ncbi:hypothetical protein A6F68_00863 [Tsuneonella dongtanensis]|uniref:Type VI secretion system-associated protein TagF n=1 Tax=Tsuneonella dongtanensis TaxID=692370 RepID=A0A1B2AB52_9SPHN|nr:type VI secretion system-associated protein TagF [Tsuneonella dongtanensis]ANY19389.1 hypothetical protein A6F68_00863 [Tsuneonella dongtanensis]
MPADALGVGEIEPPAFYGKLPGHGDFVGRGLTAGQEKAIDRWLAAWMGRARAEWADDFDARYREAQPWLFGGERLAAIAIPSSDRVGRLFPLLAAVGANVPLQQLYDTIVEAIAEGWDGDRLLTALCGLGDDTVSQDPSGWFVPDELQPAMPYPLDGSAEVTVGALLA